MTKLTVNFVNVLKLMIISIYHRHHDLIKSSSWASVNDKILKIQFLSFFKSITSFGANNSDNSDNEGNNAIISKYWPAKSLTEVLEEADQLFGQGKYLEAYETLNRLKFANEMEVQWRMGRVLFKLSFQKDIVEDIRQEMIREAYDIITDCLKTYCDCAKAHKWAAIIIDRKNGMQGLERRVKDSEKVKQHLIRCCELDPKDVTAQYLLGRWCYEMSNITWFQRIVSKLLYGEPPRSSYEEAHKYLSRAEDLHPKFYLQNTYLLGKTCLKLGQYYRAKHYFGVVGNLPVHNDYERHCAADAKKLLKRLDKYSLEKNALFYEYPFGTNE